MPWARTLVVDPVDEVLDEELRKFGIETTRFLNIDREELLRIVGIFDALVVRGKTRVDAEVLKRGATGRLKVVARAGVGLDNIDIDTARELGIAVVNAPTASTESVAELTIGFMICCARSLHRLWIELRKGVWRKDMGTELASKKLLIIGFGKIGRRVAEIARALGMEVLAYDVRDVSEEARFVGARVVRDLCKALREADVVSLHVPLTPETRGLVSREALFNCFKRDAILINTSRGAVVDPEAVLEALDRGILAAYATDVFIDEPPRSETELKLLNHPKVLATPHIGAQTREAQRRIAKELARRIVEVLVMRLRC